MKYSENSYSQTSKQSTSASAGTTELALVPCLIVTDTYLAHKYCGLIQNFVFNNNNNLFKVQ
jgi:hypothetical protein